MPICLVYEGGCMAVYSWQVLMQHYMREGRRQWARVLGAAELLGAPGTSLSVSLSLLYFYRNSDSAPRHWREGPLLRTQARPHSRHPHIWPRRTPLLT
jgi:hypothetical protein